MLEQIKTTRDFLRNVGVKDPQVGIILGTGLGSRFIKEIEDPITIPYSEIPNFPLATVTFHAGNMIYGTIRGKKTVTLQGRFHYYEGYSMQQITFPVRVMKMLGVEHLLISNASGNMNLDWETGDLMLLDDHINLQPENPLRGINHVELGNPFPDMSQPYSPAMNNKALDIAKRHGIKLHSGVYVAVTGPNLETRAEYRFLRNIGADAVGMSTVPEVIVANHINLPCCAVSVLTDTCDPANLKPVDIQQIIDVAGRAELPLTRIFVDLIAEL